MVRAHGRISGSNCSPMLWARYKETPGQSSSVLRTPGANKTSTKTVGEGYNTSLCRVSLGPSTIPFLPPLVRAQMSLLSAASLQTQSSAFKTSGDQDIVTRKWGVGWNFPAEFWFWTLFGSIRYHQIPDSWNPAPIPTPGAPDQHGSMYIGAALKKTVV